MSSFKTPLILEYIDGFSWKVAQEFEYYSDLGESRYDIRIPSGFITDFASIPRVFWRVLPPTGEYGKAAVVHDFLYASHLELNCAKSFADSVFLEAMGVLGVSAWKKHIMYQAVKMFGGLAWRGHEKKTK